MAEAEYVFEVSFEICNKVGGIYTVISSKAARMVEEYGEGYYAIGFYDASKAKIEFDERDPPKPFEEAFAELGDHGIICRYGTWRVPGKPNAILIDARGSDLNVDAIKAGLWENYDIDSIRSDVWFNDPLIWSFSCGMLIESLMKRKPFEGAKVVGHFHEWLAGFALLHLHEQKLQVATVFTTHATMLGRSMSAQGVDLYDIVNAGLERGETATRDLAKRYGCEDKFSMEVACANNADVFSTVSDVTGREAEYILGVKPHVLLYNGLDMSRFPEMEELTVKRRKYRRIMRDFLRSFFCRYYYVDFENIRSLFISGRYEYHNKGIDVLIDALGKLNRNMKEEGSKKKLVAFIFVPTGTRGEDIQVLKNKAQYEEIMDQIEGMLPDIRERMLTSVTKGEVPSSDILSEEDKQQLRKLATHFVEKRGRNPPLSAFEFSYPIGDDNVIKALARNELWNREEDMVKVVFYPAYLSSADRLISLDYNPATLTCDVGVFPSFYEPWGYTPLETVAQGTLAITSDLAGYGQFMKGKGKGVSVLSMDNARYEDIVDELLDKLAEIVKMERAELTRRRMNAKELSFLADWKNLIRNYTTAHDLALVNLSKKD